MSPGEHLVEATAKVYLAHVNGRWEVSDVNLDGYPLDIDTYLACNETLDPPHLETDECRTALEATSNEVTPHQLYEALGRALGHRKETV